MKHFLITRFNVPFENWKTTKNGTPVLTDEWMNDRFELFEKYCLPSVINQTNQQFKWCIFFDVNTKDSFKEKINNYVSSYPNIIPIYIESSKELVTRLVEYIKEDTTTPDYIITTRLDNDDILHQDFISTIQSKSSASHNLLIDLRAGFQASLTTKGSQIREITNYSFNHFVSLVEDSEKLETVWSKQHTDWINSNSIVTEETKKLWIQLVHETNKHNSTRKLQKRIHSIDNNKFGTSKHPIKDNYVAVALMNTILPVVRFSRNILKKPSAK